MYIDLNATEPVEFDFDEALSAAELALEGGEDVSALAVRLRGHGVRDEPGEVALDGTIDARLRLRCGRCLEAFDESIRTSFELILVAQREGPEPPDGHEMDERDALLFFGTHGRVELADVAREQIYLSLPLKPLCEPDCRGLCPTCGVNRNRLECACRSEDLDARLAPLLELKKKLRGS